MYECLGIQTEGMLNVKEEFNYMNVDGEEEHHSLADRLKNIFSNTEYNAQKSVNNAEPISLKDMILC